MELIEVEIFKDLEKIVRKIITKHHCKKPREANTLDDQSLRLVHGKHLSIKRI